MEAFRLFAALTVARDAGFTTLAAIILMVAFSFEPAIAFSIGASIALTFSVFLLLRADGLDEDHIASTEPWRILEPEERPRGTSDRSTACDVFEQILFRFAYAAAGLAVALYGAALLASIGTEMSSAHALADLPTS